LLEEDEQWALRSAERIVTQAQQQQRSVFEVVPARSGETPSPRPVQIFEPSAESLLVVARIAGG
jgi:hypothetical protein